MSFSIISVISGVSGNSGESIWPVNMGPLDWESSAMLGSDDM